MTRTVNVIHDPTNLQRAALLAKEIAKNNLSVKFWPAIKGDIAEAHKQVVRWAKENKLKEVIIAEDDFFFYSKWGFDYFLDYKPKSFDVYVGGIYTGGRALPNEGNIVTRFTGLHFYVVHSRFFDLFLDLDTSREGIDLAISRSAQSGFGKIVCCYPYAVVQQELPSTNKIGIGAINRHKHYFNKENTYGFEKSAQELYSNG